jgi:hypothetical protein
MKDDEKYPRNDRAAYGEMLRAAAAAVDEENRAHRTAYGEMRDYAAEEMDKHTRWEAARRHVRAGQPDDPTAYDPERDFHRDHRIHRIAGPVIPPHRSKSERVVDAVLVFLIVALVTAAALQAAGVLTQ